MYFCLDMYEDWTKKAVMLGEDIINKKQFRNNFVTITWNILWQYARCFNYINSEIKSIILK